MADRLDKDAFFRKLDGLDASRLRALLWTVYWRGSGSVRERIEDLLEGPDAPARSGKQADLDGEAVLAEAEEFASLARSGAYLGGSRKVRPAERSRWRFTFKGLLDKAARVIRKPDILNGGPALAELLDLAHSCKRFDYFRSEDPVEAMKLVFSDYVKILWSGTLEQEGFDTFRHEAASQVISWEEGFGWTRTGFGSVPEKETSLADVLAGLLRGQDAWAGFAHAYIEALTVAASATAKTAEGLRSPADGKRWREHQRETRGERLGHLNELLVEHLVGSDDEPLLDRIAGHDAFGGGEHIFFQAKLARRRGKIEEARELLGHGLKKLPGHREMREFARELGVAAPDLAPGGTILVIGAGRRR